MADEALDNGLAAQFAPVASAGVVLQKTLEHRDCVGAVFGIDIAGHGHGWEPSHHRQHGQHARRHREERGQCRVVQCRQPVREAQPHFGPVGTVQVDEDRTQCVHPETRSTILQRGMPGRPPRLGRPRRPSRPASGRWSRRRTCRAGVHTGSPRKLAAGVQRNAGGLQQCDALRFRDHERNPDSDVGCAKTANHAVLSPVRAMR